MSSHLASDCGATVVTDLSGRANVRSSETNAAPSVACTTSQSRVTTKSSLLLPTTAADTKVERYPERNR